MLRSKGLNLVAVTVLASLAFVGQAVAQESRPADRGPGGGRGNGFGRVGRGGDPAQMRAEIEKAMKQYLGATDDEWKVLQPKIEKVQNAQRESRGGANFGRLFQIMRGEASSRDGGDRGGRGGDRGAGQPGQPERTPSAVEKAMEGLTKVLDNKDSKPEEIKAALQGVRDARTKAKANLEAAQKELTEVLTPKQEAQLVELGLLE